MKLFSVSIGLILAALVVFYVPVSFAVDGFGLIVNPGGVRTIRATEAGTVLHFASDEGQFQPGQIVSAVTYSEAVAENALLLGTMHRELAKVDADHLEKTSKLQVEIDRDRAKKTATAGRVAARDVLIADTAEVLAALQDFTLESLSDITSLNEERLAQLAQLEELVKKSKEASALPAQRIATMMEDIQSDRLSVITSKGATFSTDKMILDMVKGQNDLIYSNSIDEAEIEILARQIADLEAQIAELDRLRDKQHAETEARYLAKAMLPQVAIANEISVDMRTLQASRADVARADALRLLATGTPVAGISFLIYGAPQQGAITLHHGPREVELSLPVDRAAMRAALEDAGLAVKEISQDEQTIGAIDVVSVFVALARLPQDRVAITSARARDAFDRPVQVVADISLPDSFGARQATGPSREIIGFLENRHSVVLQPGQRVRGSINDTRTGSEIVFDATLLKRDVSTVDTRELGIRLGNQSLADKIIRRGVLSQVVVEVSESSAEEISHLPGAVVHLSFPLARQSLFNFLMAKNAEI